MFSDRLGQPKCKCLVFNTKFDHSSYEKKIDLDVANLDSIFYVKCDHFSICVNIYTIIRTMCPPGYHHVHTSLYTSV